MPFAAVVGDPVEHSLSPVLHQAGYAALGLTGWEYDARRVASGALAGFLDSLRGEWRGLSVTAPLKREALGLAVTLTDRARLAGGVNTLIPVAGGRWAGDNTDLPGAVAAIEERFDGSLATATILGGGATAASVGLAVADLGVSRIVLAVRAPATAGETVGLLRGHPAGPVVEVVPLAEAEPADVVVATIPAGAQTPALVERLFEVPLLFEVTYNQWPTPLARAATGALVSGLDLLVHQAVLQFEQFTGAPAPLAAMRAAGEAALASPTPLTSRKLTPKSW
ncbi:shikimate dehydrogenase [Nocardioides sp.]|uniref:shikimate dehydrogenase n=1 Tax=Nocardioides sp. TaxID=35761 RepID=UPI0039E68C18